jgi:hypothetical protein
MTTSQPVDPLHVATAIDMQLIASGPVSSKIVTNLLTALGGAQPREADRKRLLRALAERREDIDRAFAILIDYLAEEHRSTDERSR